MVVGSSKRYFTIVMQGQQELHKVSMISIQRFVLPAWEIPRYCIHQISTTTDTEVSTTRYGGIWYDWGLHDSKRYDIIVMVKQQWDTVGCLGFRCQDLLPQVWELLWQYLQQISTGTNTEVSTTQHSGVWYPWVLHGSKRYNIIVMVEHQGDTVAYLEFHCQDLLSWVWEILRQYLQQISTGTDMRVSA